MIVFHAIWERMHFLHRVLRLEKSRRFFRFVRLASWFSESIVSILLAVKYEIEP